MCSTSWLSIFLSPWRNIILGYRRQLGVEWLWRYILVWRTHHVYELHMWDATFHHTKLSISFRLKGMLIVLLLLLLLIYWRFCCSHWMENCSAVATAAAFVFIHKAYHFFLLAQCIYYPHYSFNVFFSLFFFFCSIFHVLRCVDFLMLENITSQFRQPCILDLKMGKWHWKRMAHKRRTIYNTIWFFYIFFLTFYFRFIIIPQARDNTETMHRLKSAANKWLNVQQAHQER